MTRRPDGAACLFPVNILHLVAITKHVRSVGKGREVAHYHLHPRPPFRHRNGGAESRGTLVLGGVACDRAQLVPADNAQIAGGTVGRVGKVELQESGQHPEVSGLHDLGQSNHVSRRGQDKVCHTGQSPGATP